MIGSSVRITAVLKTEYSDFLSFCEKAGKVYTYELSNVDYVAFRVAFGQTREYIEQIKKLVNGSKLIENDLPNFTREDSVDLALSERSEEKESDSSLSSSLNNEIITEETDSDYDEKPTETIQIYENTKNSDQNSYNAEDKITIAELFGVLSSDFKDCSVELLDLNVRSSNCIRSAKIMTIADVLNSTLDSLRHIRNMGTKSLDELIKHTKDFVSNPDNFNYSLINRTSSSNGELTKRSILTRKYTDIINSFLLGGEFNENELNESQQIHFQQVKNAAEEIGIEICAEAYFHPDYCKTICGALNDFSLPNIKNMQMKANLELFANDIPMIFSEKKITPFLSAYSSKKENNISNVASEYIKDLTIFEFKSIVSKLAADEACKQAIPEIVLFMQWLNLDIKNIVSNFNERLKNLVSSKNDRTYEVFLRRNSGETLEGLGSSYGVTRERVRQIESKFYKSFWALYSKQKYDLIMLLSAIRNGDTVLHYKEIEEIIGDFAFVLWACIKHNPNHKRYYYSKTLDVIVIRAENVQTVSEKQLLGNANAFINSLPDIMEIDRRNTYIEDFVSTSAVPKELIENVFDATYQCTGLFFNKIRITGIYMCNYVLKHRFPTGFKIADEFETNRFRQYMVDLFGEQAASMTNRAIDAKIGELGILCDRGKYIHPDFLQVDQKIIDAINDYIDTSSRSIIPYGEVFEALKNIFEGTQISNRYVLQGTLKKYGCRFNTGRDFIRKSSSITFADELEAFVKERGIVHKSEIFAEFTSLGEPGLGQVVSRCSNVFNIDNGYYMHSSEFDIRPEDYEYLRGFLMDACKEIPVNIRAVYDSISLQYPEFVFRNDFDDRNKLFAALNYMFASEFSFSRPYIARLGVSEISNRSVILQHINDYETIDIEELIDICEENNINYVAFSYLHQMLLPDYIRINQTTLMKKELTGITDEIVDDVIDIVEDMLEPVGYIVGSKVYDYLWFPEINVDWNEFLLESIILQSKKINIVNLIGDPLKHPNSVYVTDKYKGETFISLLLKLLTKEVKNNAFLSKVEMREWLKEEGFIEGKLPNFLERAKYFYVDETGVHCTEE